MTEENVELARRATERFVAGDPDLELYTEDFQLRNLPDAPWQPSPGVTGMREWLDFTEEISDEWGADLGEFEAVDSQHVLGSATLWARFRATGMRQEIPIVEIVTIVDGKISRVETYHSREQALEATGLSE
jgi:hypothetical protein